MPHTANLICSSCGLPKFWAKGGGRIFFVACRGCGRQWSLKLPGNLTLHLHEIEATYAMEPEGEG